MGITVNCALNAVAPALEYVRNGDVCNSLVDEDLPFPRPDDNENCPF